MKRACSSRSEHSSAAICDENFEACGTPFDAVGAGFPACSGNVSGAVNACRRCRVVKITFDAPVGN